MHVTNIFKRFFQKLGSRATKLVLNFVSYLFCLIRYFGVSFIYFLSDTLKLLLWLIFCRIVIIQLEKFCIDSKAHCEGVIPLSPFCRRGLNPFNLAYNVCRPDVRLKLTASTINQLKPVFQQSCSQRLTTAGLAVSSPAVAETIPSLHLYLERDGQA